MTNELTIVEATSLREHEAIIRRHEIGFVAVGLALTAISVGKLYRKTHTSFEAYLDEVWGWSKSHAFRQIDAARVYGKLSPIGDGLTLPANESQARPLTGIETKEVEGVWREVVSIAPLDEAGKPKITAALVQHTVDLHRGDPKPPDQTSTDVDIQPVGAERISGDRCPKCEVCNGLSHHWMADPQADISLPEYECAHCTTRGRGCKECGGDGCLACGGEGVIQHVEQPERFCADCDGPEGQCGCTAVVEVDDPDPVEIPEDATAIPALGDLTEDDMNMVAEMLGACLDALDELEHVPTAGAWIRFGEQLARYVTTKVHEAN